MAEQSETLRSRWGNDARTALLDTERQVSRRFQSLWTGFTAFALRDNVLEVAVGLMYVLLLHSSGAATSSPGLADQSFRGHN
jgi:hypothetical protein